MHTVPYNEQPDKTVLEFPDKLDSVPTDKDQKHMFNILNYRTRRKKFSFLPLKS